MSSQDSKNILPSSLHDLNSRELFLFTQIPVYLLDGFISGKFKPNTPEREILSALTRQFYPLNKTAKKGFIERKKFRAVRKFISFSEKEHLFSQQKGNVYNRVLDKYLAKYWDQIVLSFAEKKLE